MQFKDKHGKEILYYENFNIETSELPLKADVFCELLRQSQYDPTEIKFLEEGLTEGFDIGYEGSQEVKLTSPNLKLNGIGDETTLWNKVMKEVKLGRFAGPFTEIPFKDHYIQSPIGLVDKDGGKDTRLIFHLSYPRGKGLSVNENTPDYKCTVHYPEFDEAIRLCLKEGVHCLIARSDVKSAFRNLKLKPSQFWLLVMKAKSPIDGRIYFFVEKNLPFGGSISCSHFQRVSNGIAHLVKFRTKKENINYLDDFLFAALIRYLCNLQVRIFIQICEQIGMPVNTDKTFWGSTLLTFLGLLINTSDQTVSIPLEKIKRGMELIDMALNKKSKKITLHELQRICGFLNFLGRAIVPGRAFTRRLYSYTSGQLKPHHHIKLNGEMRQDLYMWKTFLTHPMAFCRPFIDFEKTWKASEINFYTDASGKWGYGGICQNSFMIGRWQHDFIERNPSIAYKELYAVAAAILAWIHRYRNQRVILFVDNKSVRDMINSNSSSCRNCMVLIRLIVLKSLVENVRVFAKYIKSSDNTCADLLSRGNLRKFRLLTKRKYESQPTSTPSELLPQLDLLTN